MKPDGLFAWLYHAILVQHIRVLVLILVCILVLVLVLLVVCL